MPAHWTSLFSFITGAVRRRDLGYLMRESDELSALKVEHCYISVWHQNTWLGGDIDRLPWSAVAATIVTSPLEQALVLGLWGQVFCDGSGDTHEERIRAGQSDSPENRGPMRFVRAIGGTAYAVGTHRQVYRRQGANSWVCIDQAIRPTTSEGITSFETIGGFSHEEIYTAGRKGELWLYDSKKWVRLNSPTNMILTNLCCAPDGNVYICGRFGTLLRGRHATWSVIDQDVTREDFWGIAYFKDKLYLATTRQLYSLEGDSIAPVRIPEQIVRSYFHLSEADGVLWSIGAKDVLSFDGVNWSRID